MSDSVRPHRRQPIRLPRPWDSPGKNTGVGCHFLLQCRKVKSQSEVTQSCLTLRNPMDCSLPGSSIHGIFQARVLEWGAIAFSVCLPTRFYLIRPPSTILVISFANLLLRTLAQAVNSSTAMQETEETQIKSLGWEDPREEEMATHSNILAWRTPWTEESGRLQAMDSQRVRHN